MKANTPDNLDELYESLPEEERLIAMVLRELIFEALPDIREKKSYGAPFYFGKKMICYVWPASITWGGKRQGEGVTLGFSQAKKLKHGNFLNFGTRKSIGSHVFRRAEEIEVEKVVGLLKSAWEVDRSS
jgi:hypothetical protein